MKETPEKHAVAPQAGQTPASELDFDPATYTNPVLEECYRIKREINAEFNSLQEYHEYLVAQSAKWKKLGWKYRSVPPRRVEAFSPQVGFKPDKRGEEEETERA